MLLQQEQGFLSIGGKPAEVFVFRPGTSDRNFFIETGAKKGWLMGRSCDTHATYGIIVVSGALLQHQLGNHLS